MKRPIGILFAAACLAACAREKPVENPSITEITRGTTQVRVPEAPTRGAMARNRDVRQHMHDQVPEADAVIRGIIITDDGEVITLTGVVPDEETHQKLLKAARDTQDVKRVKDELKVQKHR